MKRIIPLAAVVACLFAVPAMAGVNCFKSGDNLQCSGADDETGAPIDITGTVTDGTGTLSGTVGDKPVTANATPAGNSILINGSYDGGEVFGACYLNSDGTTCI